MVSSTYLYSVDGLENNNKPFHPKSDRFGSSANNSDFVEGCVLESSASLKCSNMNH